MPKLKRFGDFDEDEFKVAASDPRNGARAQPRFGIHPAYIEQLMSTFHSGVFPYETPDAMYRHAIKRHVAWLLGVAAQIGQGDRIPSIMQHLEIIDRVVLEEERMANFTASIDKIEEVVRKTANNPGGERRVKELLVRLWGEVKAMPVGYWRALYRKMFKAKFAAELQRNPQAASLILLGDYADEEIEEDDERNEQQPEI